MHPRAPRFAIWTSGARRHRAGADERAGFAILDALVVGDAALATGAGLGFEPVDEIDGHKEAAARASADAVAGDGDGQMDLACAGSSDQHGVALFGQERCAGEAAYQLFVDRRPLEQEVVDVRAGAP